MKLKDFHKMIGLKTEEQIQTYYRIHNLAIYSCIKCGEIIYNIDHMCPHCSYFGGKILKKEKNKLV